MRSRSQAPGRRNFLKALAVSSVLPVMTGAPAAAVSPTPNSDPKASARPSLAGTQPMAPETQPPVADALVGQRPGSDYMVDAIKALDIDYVAVNPGSSFRSIHESLINYGGNVRPELLTCLHEETSVGLAHGYARANRKPMMTLLHSVVGVQHAAMSIYNAFCDRAPVIMLTANMADANWRHPGVEWFHSATDIGGLVRDFTKWDDQPGSLEHFCESLPRGHQVATSFPQAPVLIVADSQIQEAGVAPETAPRILKPAPLRPATADPAALEMIAKWLADAEQPLILADRYANGPNALPALVKLAETAAVGVADLGGRFNFPTRHPLNLTFGLKSVASKADFILVLEPVDLSGALSLFRESTRERIDIVSAKTRVVVLGLDPVLRSNYQEFQDYFPASMFVDGDAEASVPLLTEALRRILATSARQKLTQRAARIASKTSDMLVAARNAAAVGWELSPISTARLSMEIWKAIDGREWTLSGQTWTTSNWAMRLWQMDQAHQCVCVAGAAALGSFVSTALGVALANKAKGRFTVNIQSDGDLLYAPGALWTAVHHRIPMLTVMHNNRAYNQEFMHLAQMAARHGRGIERIGIGTTITDPNVDFAKLAQSMGMWAEGPINDPAALGPALARAVAVVESGHPALVDVVCQPR